MADVSALIAVVMTAGVAADQAPRVDTYVLSVRPTVECLDFIESPDRVTEPGPDVKVYKDRPVMMTRYSCLLLTEGTADEIKAISAQ